MKDCNSDHGCDGHHHDHYYYIGDGDSGGFCDSDGRIVGWILLIFGIALILVMK